MYSEPDDINDCVVFRRAEQLFLQLFTGIYLLEGREFLILFESFVLSTSDFVQ